MGARHGRYAWHVVLLRCAANCLFVIMRGAAQRRVYDQSNFALLDMIGDVGPSFVDFEDGGAFKTHLAQARRRAYSRHQIKSEPRKLSRQHDRLAFISLVNADEGGAALR